MGFMLGGLVRSGNETKRAVVVERLRHDFVADSQLVNRGDRFVVFPHVDRGSDLKTQRLA